MTGIPSTALQLRLNIMDTALAAVIGSMDQNSPGLQWKTDIGTIDMITEMTGLASLGEVMAAVSLGSIMAEHADGRTGSSSGGRPRREIRQ